MTDPRPLHRRLRWGLLLLLLFVGAAACNSEEEKEDEETADQEEADGGEPAPVEAPAEAPTSAPAAQAAPARVRVLQASPKARPAVVHVDGAEIPGIGALGSTLGELRQATLPAGPRWFSLHGQGDGGALAEELATDAAELQPDKDYLLLVAGELDRPGPRAALRLLRDDQVEPSKPQQAVVRFINASPDLPALDALLQPATERRQPGEGVLFVNVGFGKGSTYRAIAPGQKLLTVRDSFASASSFYDLEQIDVQAGDKIILVLSGGPRLDNDTAHVEIIRQR
jgi:pyruvate/2-oxoglutarate dehydrogenase complex dihydrolipoamide acyltransferase (E2) component